MAIDKENFPIVLAIFENFGLSSSWTGNAIASANPENFYSMWRKNPHTALFPNKDIHTNSFENSDIDLTRLFSGKAILCNKDYFDLEIKNNKMKDNSVLSKTLAETTEHNSAIHLIGSLPGPDDKYSDMNQLLSLIETIKEKNTFRVYLHLIVDNSIGNDTKIAENFISKINQTGICEIASVIGKNYLDDNISSARDFTKAIEAIVTGDGNKALSPEQALNFRGLIGPDYKKPTSILFNNRYVYKINNFDTIIFYNHNNQPFTKLALALANGSGASFHSKMPKFLKIVSIFDFADQELEQLEILFKRDSSKTLAQSLYSAGIDQLFLSDTTRAFSINKHLKGKIEGDGGSIKELFVPIIRGSSPLLYDQALELMLKQVSLYLKEKRSRFITLIIPVLSSTGITTFAQTIEVIKVIDKFLPKIEAEVKKHNAMLILTSDHGGAEKMSERNNFETKNSKTNNPVPLILSIPGYRASNDNKMQTVPNRMLYDMMKKSHYICDLAPTILELFRVKVPDIMTGKSFLPELRVEVDE